jgi:hypothetical protein
MFILPRGLWLVFSGALLLAASSLGLAAQKTESTRGLQPVVLTLPGDTRPIALYGESHALVIGAADYNNGWPRLPGVVGDVEAVAKTLEQQGFTVTKVLNPASDKLDKAIKRFIGQYGQKPDSRLLIYFAGHGYTLKPDAERQLGYLVPVDAPLADRDLGGFIEAALSMESLEGYAKQIRAKHALFVFDSCFSGSFFKMRAAPEVIALKTTRPVRQFITSGGADQQVPDVSVFRQQFIAALNGEGDLNGDGYITGSELGSFLEDKVTNYSRQTQIPQYGKIRDPALDKGDFVFVLAKLEPRPEPAQIEPAAPQISRMSLDGIKKQQAVRDGWADWQTRMRTDFGQVNEMQVAPELKSAAWEQYLAAYPDTNPYSGEADSLREQAKQKLGEVKRQSVTAKPTSAGVINQTLRQQDSWKTEIKVRCLDEDKTCGQIHFRSLNCGGDLIFRQTSNNGYLFDENLNYGKCVPGCQIWLDPTGSNFKEICNKKVAGTGRLSNQTHE